ncbi:rRNA adenine N-6-methyltransferase family protein [Cuniculiplasma sp. SKW3]|uniref:rRNA adenine N-6-methyltransferase family protein n=1 Tax=Cuniculiplasma sp. SKW3 TaxID=3400170 RepID=UPI003FD672AC
MHHHKGFDYERMDEMRQKMVDVDKILDFMDLKVDDIICDMGSGSGFYSVLFAKKCNHVYSFEWNERGNNILKKKMSDEKINNVTIRNENICEKSTFPDCTKVFFSNSFHDFECREELIERFQGKSRPDFILIEFNKDTEMGPPVEIRIDKKELNEIFSRHNYRLKKTMDFHSNYVSYFEHE